MITQAEFQSLSAVRETSEHTADELTLFVSPVTGEARIVIRRLRRDEAGRWRTDREVAARVVDDVRAPDIAGLFGVTTEEAEKMLIVARRDGDGERPEGKVGPRGR